MKVRFAVLGLTLLAVAGCGEFSRFGGMRSSYPAKDHDPFLTEIAQKAGPIVEAVKAHLEQHSTYPRSLSVVEDWLPDEGIQRTAEGGVYWFREWSYIPEPDGFRLYYSLGRDPSLNYDSRHDTWTFDPGDGSPTKVIVLDPWGGAKPGKEGGAPKE